MDFGRVLLAAFVTLLLAATPGFALDHIIERAVLEDRDGTLSIEDVVGADFQPGGMILARGYTPEVTWLRIVVRPPAGAVELRLHIRPTYLDYLTLFEADESSASGWRERTTGDRVPFSQRDVPGVNLGFVIQPVPAADTTYYLRLQTTSTSLLHVQALTPNDAVVLEWRYNFFYVASFVVMGWIILWATREWLLRRERIVGLFIISEVTFVLYDLSLLGYLAPLFPDSAVTPDFLTSVLVCLAPLMAQVFHRSLVVPFEPHWLALRGWEAGMVLIGVALLLVLFGNTQAGVHLNAVGILLAGPLFFALAFTARRNAASGLFILRLAYVAQAVSLTVSLIPVLGFFEATDWNLHATLVHGMISACLMFLVLHAHARQQRLQGLRARIDLELARQQLDMERQQRDIQERFVAMLTHELKTPLSVVRLATSMARTEGEPKRLIDTALSDMTALVDRCAYTARLEQEQIEVRRTPCDLCEVLSRVVQQAADPRRIHLAAAVMPSVACDRPLLSVMLGNLIDNALKYSPDDTTVEIHAEQQAVDGRGGVRIRIDSLPGRAGLPDPERVFEKFYRASGAHRKTGSGLGLYIVRGIAQLTGSRVDYDVVWPDPIGWSGFNLSA